MNNLHKFLLGALALAAVVAIFWFFGDIVFYILIAGVLAIMCQPLVGKVAGMKVLGRKLPRWVAAIVGVLAVWFVILLFFVLFIPLISVLYALFREVIYARVKKKRNNGELSPVNPQEPLLEEDIGKAEKEADTESKDATECSEENA